MKKDITLFYLWCVCLLLLGTVVHVSGQMIYTAPASSTTGAAPLTNLLLNGIDLPVSGTATNTTRTWDGVPASISAAVVVSNGVPYVNVGFAPTTTNVPTISGAPFVGNTLTGAVGSWVAVPAATVVDYWWQTNSVLVSGATGTTLELTAAYLSATAVFGVVQSNSFGVTTNWSAATAAITNVSSWRITSGTTTPTVDPENLGSGYTEGETVTLVGGTPTTAATFIVHVEGETVTYISAYPSEGTTGGEYAEKLADGSYDTTYGGSGTGLKILIGADCWEANP